MQNAILSLLPSLQSVIYNISQGNIFNHSISQESTTSNHDQPFASLQKPNRYLIAGPNNTQTLTVPITQEDKHNPISQVRINYNENWMKDHKNAWQTAYGKSPFFEYYDYRFWSILDTQPTFLLDLVVPWNQLLFDKLGLLQLSTNNKANQTSEIQQNQFSILQYPQVFDVKFGFRSEVSAIDLLFNQGPLAKEYLSQYLPTNTIFAP